MQMCPASYPHHYSRRYKDAKSAQSPYNNNWSVKALLIHVYYHGTKRFHGPRKPASGSQVAQYKDWHQALGIKVLNSTSQSASQDRLYKMQPSSRKKIHFWSDLLFLYPFTLPKFCVLYFTDLILNNHTGIKAVLSWTSIIDLFRQKTAQSINSQAQNTHFTLGINISHPVM